MIITILDANNKPPVFSDVYYIFQMKEDDRKYTILADMFKKKKVSVCFSEEIRLSKLIRLTNLHIICGCKEVVEWWVGWPVSHLVSWHQKVCGTKYLPQILADCDET